MIIQFILSTPLIIPVFLVGYMLGAIPFGFILAHIFGLGDIRSIGSGNIGATNALRTGNKTLAFLTLVCDLLKGTAAVFITQQIVPSQLWILPYLAGFGAIIGHLFPIWLKFKGGKGVATFIGVTLALNWPTFIAVGLTWIIIARLSRISSLSALIASAQSPFYAYAFGAGYGAFFFAFFAVILWATHHANIRRLVKGEEPFIGQRK